MLPSGEPIKLEPEAKERIKFLQSKISELQRKADKSEDEDIKEGFNLEISKLGLKVSRLQKGQSEELPSEVERVEEEEFLEPLPIPTSAQLYEADNLIQRSRLEKTRGNSQAATDLLKKAAEVAPGAALVLEALGDNLLEQKHYATALEAFRNARRADPESVSIERKYAALLQYGQGGMSIEEQIHLSLSDAPMMAPGEAYASPQIATILSYMIPGSGQFVLGYSKKGFTVFGITLGCIALFFLTNYLMNPGNSSPPIFAYFFLMVALVTHIAGIYETSSLAKSLERKPINRPTPPVDKPFE